MKNINDNFYGPVASVSLKKKGPESPFVDAFEELHASIDRAARHFHMSKIAMNNELLPHIKGLMGEEFFKVIQASLEEKLEKYEEEDNSAPLEYHKDSPNYGTPFDLTIWYEEESRRRGFLVCFSTIGQALHELELGVEALVEEVNDREVEILGMQKRYIEALAREKSLKDELQAVKAEKRECSNTKTLKRAVWNGVWQFLTRLGLPVLLAGACIGGYHLAKKSDAADLDKVRQLKGQNDGTYKRIEAGQRPTAPNRALLPCSAVYKQSGEAGRACVRGLRDDWPVSN